MLAFRAGDDFKLFCVVPGRVTVSGLERLATDLRRRNLWGGVRLDIDAVLAAAEALIRHSDIFERDGVPLRGRRPREIIAGLREAHFKSLGQGAALMNEAMLPLPDWFAVGTELEAAQMLGIIEEFIGHAGSAGCLASLDAANSDDGAVLQQFRRWLLAGDIRDLLEFHAKFAPRLMAIISRGKWARAFGTENLSLLLERSYNMTEYVTNPGFLSVARAVRNKTIYSRGHGPLPLDTSFGLAQEWKLKLRAGKGDFAAAVAEFVQQYNWEVINRHQGKYHIVRTEDLDQLLRLLDQEPQTVAMLLIAYGYARAPKTATDAAEEPTA